MGYDLKNNYYKEKIKLMTVGLNRRLKKIFMEVLESQANS
jgi:hypothetical protein